MSLESSVSLWDAITFWFITAGVLLTFFGGAASILSRQYNRQLSKLTEMQNLQQRQVDQRAIAEANARASEANEKAEALKADNLELEKILMPRRLSFLVKDAGKLKAFAGTEIFVREVPDFEAMRLGRDIRWVFTRADWKPQQTTWARIGMGPLNLNEGLLILLTRPLTLTKDGSPEQLTNAQEIRVLDAAKLLNEYLQAQDIDTSFQPAMKVGRLVNLPANAILVLIGANPVFTKLSTRRPPTGTVK